LTVSYVFLALIIILSISFLFNIMLGKLFMQYALYKQEKQIEQIVDQVNQSYNEITGSFEQASLEIIGNAALQNGLILHVKNLKNEVDWDMRLHTPGKCQIMLQHAENNMNRIYPNFNGFYSESDFKLKGISGIVGYVRVGFYGPYSFNDEELYLITTINKVLIVIALVSLILAMALGLIMARRLSNPILNVVKIASKIAQGEFGIKTTFHSKTNEINELLTSINELSDKLNKTKELKKRLTNDIAHELRTPLSHLLSHTEALIDGVWVPDKDRLQSLYDELERINKMVNDLQRLVSIEDETVILQVEWFSASDFFYSIYTLFQINLEQKHIKFDFAFSKTERIFADKDRLKQILINIVSNALKYTPEHGKIIIKVFSENNCCVIIVHDNGCGIPAIDLPNIFDRFYRVDQSRTRLTGGSGVGLTIAKSLVLAHSGDITVTSEINKGTAFKIVLPTKSSL